jgi:hypothetical protein
MHSFRFSAIARAIGCSPWFHHQDGNARGMALSIGAVGDETHVPDPLIVKQLQALVPAWWSQAAMVYPADQDAWPLLVEAEHSYMKPSASQNGLDDAIQAGHTTRRSLTSDHLSLLSHWLEQNDDALALVHRACARAGINRPDFRPHDGFIRE